MAHPFVASWYEHTTLGDDVNRYAYAKITKTTWHTLRVVSKDNCCTVWIDGVLYIYKNGPRNKDVGLANRFYISSGGPCTNAKSIFIDSIKLSSTPEEATPVTPLKVNGIDLVTHLWNPLSPEDIGTSGDPDTQWSTDGPFKFRGDDGNDYGPMVVSTTHDLASAVRFSDGSTVKSFAKYPTF